jgi:predicted patatin/cPLA2 family phospholipase
MGVFSVCSSLYFYGGELIATSTVVPGFEQFGIYGTAVLAFIAVALYVPVNTWLAVSLGKICSASTFVCSSPKRAIAAN